MPDRDVTWYHTTPEMQSALTEIIIQIRNLEINVIVAFMMTHSGCNNIVEFYPTNKICFINITHSKRDALQDSSWNNSIIYMSE